MHGVILPQVQNFAFLLFKPLKLFRLAQSSCLGLKVNFVLSIRLLMKMLNSRSTPLINGHQLDMSYTLSPKLQLLFNPPNSSFSSPSFFGFQITIL